MKKKVIAITVSQNYLERKKYSIKHLIVAYRKNGEAFWFCQQVGVTSVDREELECTAKKVSVLTWIPYILDIRHGDKIIETEKNILKKYGVVV